jgi:hypothetical protein
MIMAVEDRNGWLAECLHRGTACGRNRRALVYGAGMALESVSEVVIETASDDPRELRTAAELRELLVTCDLTGLQWTSRVVIEHRVIPHSHPVLTFNTRAHGDHLLANVYTSRCTGGRQSILTSISLSGIRD